MTTPGPRRPLLAAVIAMLGLTVPIVPRVFVPLFVPGEYVDSLEKILSGSPGDTLLLFVWTALPFLVLGVVALMVPPTTPRTAGFTGALLAGLATGYVIHVPSTYYGMNFGVPAFPFYAVVIMPLGFLLCRGAAAALGSRAH